MGQAMIHDLVSDMLGGTRNVVSPWSLLCLAILRLAKNATALRRSPENLP